MQKFFDTSLSLNDVTTGHFVAFARYLSKEGYARTTIDRRVSLVRTIFSEAVEYGLIEKNPFQGIRSKLKNVMSRNNRSRQRFIERTEILRIMDFCPDDEWRCLIALSRFGGLRVPSEALSLKWSHIDFEQVRMKVPCRKLEHIEGHETRDVPIFGELRPYLDSAWDAADPGGELVISRHRPPILKSGAGWANANLRTRFEKIIKKAGCELWPQLWRNLRATRQTEPADRFPQHVVCRWMGNTGDVAMEQYLQTTDAYWEHATKVMPPVMPSDQVMPRTKSQPILPPTSYLQSEQKETAA
ncbi:phage integrase SAM-like domain-containing protein, partial [Thalassoglobus sp. JC818]|uniref:tyrosine-type recombinase/integrase n=1 Tax=Thalassoglobus sp. JC818 TaxID=3232136 RepID=UPI003458541D